MGPRITIRLERYGFYPAGGGRFTVDVQPVQALQGFDLLERGEITQRTAQVLLANLPPHIARRELDTVAEKLGWSEAELHMEEVGSAGPGNVVSLQVDCAHVTEVFTAFGRLGVRAERVADEAVQEASRWLAAGVPVGEHLADQLLLPLGISAWQVANGGDRQGGGAFRTLPLTRHSTTHIEILRKFLGVDISAESSPDAATCTVCVSSS
jgi:RNA 3'-terminal phosphate cyclase (ATP)